MNLMSTETPVNLTYLNGTGFVFNADDYMKIRSDYRVVGSLIGTCNVRGWTPSINGLPAAFNRFEIQLLIEKGFARLLRKSSLKDGPNPSTKKNYEQLKKQRIREQESVLKLEKLKESQKNIDKILAGKKKKLLKAGKLEEDIHLTPEIVLQEISDSIVFDEQNALHDIPYEYPFDHEATIMRSPSDTSLKYRVFKDLWERGKFITSGEAFGADFIAYPGDPMMFHASHIVIVLDEPEINKLELIAKGRLSVIVNKICIFAYSKSGSDSDEILYQTLHWEGCKDNLKSI